MKSIAGNFRKGFSQEFDGRIWKLLLHEVSGLMAVETRELDTGKVSYSVISISSGKTNFLQRSLNQTGNLNLFHLTGEFLLLNSYKHAGSPEAQGLICIHSSTGELAWEQYQISPDLANEEGIRVFNTKILPRKYYWIDYSGKIILPLKEQPENSSLFFPDEQSITDLPHKFNHGDLCGQLSLLTYESYNIYSFHEKVDDLLQQRIVVTQEDRIMLDDILIGGIQNLQPEAFFIQNDTLFYIRNKREIMSYFL